MAELVELAFEVLAVACFLFSAIPGPLLSGRERSVLR